MYLTVIYKVDKTKSTLSVVVSDDELLVLYSDNVDVLRGLVVREIENNFGGHF